MHIYTRGIHIYIYVYIFRNVAITCVIYINIYIYTYLYIYVGMTCVTCQPASQPDTKGLDDPHIAPALTSYLVASLRENASM